MSPPTPISPSFLTLGITVDDASLLLKRVLTKSGSRCYINAQLATVAMLQQAGQYLVDILGQHQQQTLLQREQQLALLDSFGKLTEEHRPAARLSLPYPRTGLSACTPGSTAAAAAAGALTVSIAGD